MNKIGCVFRLLHQQPSHVMARRAAGGVGVAILLMTTGAAVAQIQVSTAPPVVPQGYAVHETVDLGGHMVGLTGAGAMYDTMVNMQSGPRVLGVTYEMHALPSNKNALFDDLKAFSNGFGGDPNNYAELDASKGKYYEFTGVFRRDRQYFDYDLLGNPNIPSGQSVPIGPTAAPTGSFPWPQVNQSPFLFNTVRRMTDTRITILPEARVTYRAGYSQNIFQGPSLTPSGYQFGQSYSVLVQEYQRNSTDDFYGGIDWKPVRGTKLTFEEEIDHYKANSYFTLNPSGLIWQEADGTKVAPLTNYFNLTPYSSSSCASGSILSAPNTPGGLPVVDPSCNVASSYLRSQPTRIIYPTEIFRLQSSSIKNVEMNGNVRYTSANMSLPDYYENFQGLNGTTRSVAYTAHANAERKVIVADYGIVWQAAPKFGLSDQIDFWNVQQPGTATMTSVTTLSTPAGNATITYPGPLTTKTGAAGSSTFEGSGSVGVPLPGFFGQRYVINNLTATWDATSRTVFTLTYRHGNHRIAEGIPHNAPLAPGATNNGTVTINEDGGILNAAFRPTDNWNINGTIEMFYNDNAFTPMGARQFKQYRLHTIYRPKSWATISGAFNDRERHNNTNNTGTTPIDGPLDHVDHARIGSVSADLFPNEHYGIDFSYAYTDVYMADNICYLASATPAYPGAAPPNGMAGPDPSAKAFGPPPPNYEFGPVRNFMDAPTQSGTVAITMSPVKSIHSDIGYNISSVNGSRFFNDARDVNGSLVSTYQYPFVDLTWTSRPGLKWMAEYNFYGYGEGGPSGAPYCSTSDPTQPSGTVPVVPCNSSALNGAQTGLTISPAGETAPRNFHANMVSMGVHYEF